MPCPADAFTGESFEDWDFRNWLGNVAVRSERHFEPDSLGSLVRVVADASAAGRHVRVIGRGWSFEDIAAARRPSGWTVSLNKLASFKDEIVTGPNSALNETWRQNVAGGRPLVCVEAGIRLRALNLELDNRGLAMITLGGSQGQTVGGATSTSTHGSDVDEPPVSDVIRAVHLVTVGGQELWVESDTDPLTEDSRLEPHLACDDVRILRSDRLLKALQVGVGCFGVVYAVVLEVRQRYVLFEESVVRAWSDVAELLRAGAGTAAPLQPLFDALPATGHGPVVGDPSLPRFLEILMSSRTNGPAWVRRRWESSLPVVPDPGEGTEEEFYCNRLMSMWILNSGSAILRLIASAIWAPIPIYGAIRAAEIEQRAVGLDVLALQGVPGGRAISAAADAIWWADPFGIFGDVIDALTQDQVNSFIGKRTNRVGPSWQIMIGAGEGGSPCSLVNSTEPVFGTSDAAYVDFVDWLLDAGRSYRQAGYISVRVSKPSEALLSMHNVAGANAVSIEVVSPVGLSGNDAWMQAVEARAIELGGRPHWGQQNRLTADQVQRMYGPALTAWREELGGIMGTSFGQFVNDYAEQRGLVAGPFRRKVTAVRRAPGRITALCDPASSWQCVDADDAMADIAAGRAEYYVQTVDTDDPVTIEVRQVLTTAPDESEENNLDAVSSRPRHEAFPNGTGRDRTVTSVERDGYGRTLYLNNDQDQWSVPFAIAWAETRAGTFRYVLQAGDKRLLAREYLTTPPDTLTRNNLDSLPAV